jgi:thiosulfate dehydrogenase [quinone] large subunit
MSLPLFDKLNATAKKLGIAQASGWSHIPAWAILPLRGFLGITFVYAGLQKITDAQFFDDASHHSIKYQLEIFSHSSPLRWLLVNLAIPHADLFGWLIALGELLVGLATLLGLFGRLTASAGVFISGLLWLTATWSVSPYFLGPDSIYAMAWLTLLLAGMGDYSVDGWLKTKRQQEQTSLLARQRRAQQRNQPAQPGSASAVLAEPLLPSGQREVNRRAVLRGLIAGGAVLATGLVSALTAQAAVPILQGVIQNLKRLRGRGREADEGNGGASASNPTPLPGTPAGAVGNISQIPANGAFAFTLKASGDPGIIINLSANHYVAYDATCTHAGCTVGYDPTTQALLCPCHGAAFDPANNAAVLAGPTSVPLSAVPLHIDANGNIFVGGQTNPGK